MTTDGHHSPDNDGEAGIEELVDIPRFKLGQWSSDAWKSVPNKNVSVIKIKEGTDHYGTGWWANFLLAQQDVLRAEVVSEYNLQSNGFYRIQGRICSFNDEFTLVLVSTGCAIRTFGISTWNNSVVFQPILTNEHDYETSFSTILTISQYTPNNALKL